MDDQTPSILQAASKAMSILFYNQIDEALLDLTFDCSNNLIQPIFDVGSGLQASHDEDLGAKFSQMNLQKGQKRFETTAELEEEDELASMNDFHLAETNLAKCLLRTDILERIRWECCLDI